MLAPCLVIFGCKNNPYSLVFSVYEVGMIMKKLGIVFMVSIMLSFVLAGCGLKNDDSSNNGAGKKNDKAVIEFISEKYGFTPEIISAEEVIDTNVDGVVVTKEHTGIYNYVVKDESGKEFDVRYYSSSKVIQDNYLEDYYTEEMSKKVADILGVELADFYFGYSSHNMFGEEKYGTVEEVLMNADIAKVYATTYDDFDAYKLDELDEYRITFEIAKINREYSGKEKINIGDNFNFANFLEIDYFAKKLYNSSEYDVKTFHRIELDDNIIYVHFDRVDVTYQVEAVKVDDEQVFEDIDTPANTVSPVFNINSGEHGQGVVFFTGKYFAGYDKDRTVVLERYEKNGNVSSGVNANIVPVAKYDAMYYDVTIGNVTIALAEK